MKRIADTAATPPRPVDVQGLVVIEVEHAFNGVSDWLALEADELDGQRVRAVERRTGAIEVFLDGAASAATASPGRFELHLDSETVHPTSLRFTLKEGRRLLAQSYAWAPDWFTFRLPGRTA